MPFKLYVSFFEFKCQFSGPFSDRSETGLERRLGITGFIIYQNDEKTIKG